MGKSKLEWETRFENVLNRSDYKYQRNPTVRINSPVENRFGKSTKVVTTPDFLVFKDNPDSGCYVEVTQGNGNSPHKAAQKRVIERAKIENYRILSSNEIYILEKSPDWLLRGLLQTVFKI